MKIKKIFLLIFGVFLFGFLVFYNLKYILPSRATNPGLYIKIKLQGDYSQTTNLILKTKIAAYTPSEKITEFTAQSLTQVNDNIFSINLPINGFDLTKTYRIFIKPEKYLGKLTSGYIFTNSQNTIDLTNDFFYAGDVSPADGKISSYDISTIIDNLGKTSTEAPATDLNNNGITNTQDYAMALYSLKKDVTDDEIDLSSITPTPTPTEEPTLTSTPTPTPTIATADCSTMDDELPNSTMHYASGSTSIPKTSKQIFNYDATKNYSAPYRNPNCTISESLIKKAYDRMETFYPSYWPNTRLLTDWETVQIYAKKYNFNPIFIISVWIEESAAGGATSAQQLGCLYRLNKDGTFTYLSAKSTICEQMECLFGSKAVNPTNFARWACRYELGASSWNDTTQNCTSNPNFVKTVNFWYEFLSENQPNSCKIKYY